MSYTTKNCSLSRGETIQQVGSTEQDKYSLIARTARTLDVCGKILWLEFREAAETINKTIFLKQLLKVLQGCLKKKSSAQIEEVAMHSCLGGEGHLDKNSALIKLNLGCDHSDEAFFCVNVVKILFLAKMRNR